MKKNKSNLEPLAVVSSLICVCLVFSSCRREEISFRSGHEIRFTAVTTGSVPSSKAAYSGESVDNRERINWEAGDLVCVYCAEASEPECKYADYKVDETVTPVGARSQTTIRGTGGIGLRWGDEGVVHKFYAVYPSPSEKGGDELGEGSLKGTVPAEQVPLSLNAAAESTDPNFTAEPDMDCEYMVAYNSVENGADASGVVNGSEVFLKFNPIVTAVEFTITNGFSADAEHPENELLNIKSIQLISESHDIAGTFVADLTGLNASGTAYPVCSAESAGSETVTVDFTCIPDYDYTVNTPVEDSRNYVSVAKDQTLRFTCFLMPGYSGATAVDVDDLTFKINKADGSWVSTKLAYNDASKTGIPFPCHRKTYVTGLLVPEGAQWTVKYAPGVDSWTDGGSSPENPDPETGYAPVVMPWTSGGEQERTMVKYNYTLNIVEGTLEFGHEGTSGSTIKVSSQRELDHSPTPVVWHLEYWDKPDSTWKTAKSGVQIDGFLTLNPTLGSGAGEDIELPGLAEISLTVAGVTPSETINASHDSRLRTAPARGTADAPYDLSMHDIYGTPRPSGKPVTANCYVVSAPGWYAFPLAYGNAVDSGSAPAGGVNVPAYDPGAEADPTPTNLTQFVNSNGHRILAPYVESDPADTESGWTVEVLWKDAPGISISGCSVIDMGAAPGKGLTECPCSYALFHLDAEALTQGNFVLVLKNGSQTMWSWHIWVTDNVLECVPVSSDSPCSMLPLNLGWVDSDVTTSFNSYDGKSVKLRAVQNGSGATLEFNVVRRAEDEAQHGSGSSLYWQWGRKDPFVSTPATEALTTDKSIAYSIQHPSTFICSASGKYQWYYETRTVSGSDPQEAEYRNLWSATNTLTGTASAGYNTKPAKTIYDPCPPGFQIPQADAFSTVHAGTLPTTGSLSYEGGTFTSSGGYYWNAVPSDGTGSYYTGSTTGHGRSSYRANGYSVRPVQQ